MDENNSQNMTEETDKFPVNMLTAEGLLKNRGIKCHAWDEYERSIKTLPKTGMKQFEPDNSWLQNMQLEKGIITRKNLLAVERVDRISQLASAEWLPAQKRAKVKKHSGQDWSSFGLEKNGALYLIPEEALFLLEANCLELTWNDVPLSIQQAYDLLIDNIECSLEEYRVYSQLVRYGYHIQRFIYASERNVKHDESVNTKRKVIVEPENGLWMIDTQESKDCINIDNQKSINSPEETNRDSKKPDVSPQKTNTDSEKHADCPKQLSIIDEISLDCPERTSMNSSIPVDCPEIINMDNRIPTDCPEKNTNSEKLDDCPKQMIKDDTDSSIEICQNVTEHSDVVNDVREVLNNLLGKIGNTEIQSESVEHESNIENCTKLNTDVESVNINGTNRKRNSRAEIISEETLLGSIKIVKDPSADYSKDDKMLNWRGSRIQRNVKLLPKRTDKVSASDISIIDSNTKTLEHCLGKHKSSSISKENSPIKRSKQEIIELSDDEVQEVPKPMTRMEILNLIPNIASQSTISIKVSRGYIPHSIKPHKTVYHYESSKLKNLQQTDKRLRPNKNVESSNTNQKTPQSYNSSTNNNVRRNTNIMPFHQNVTSVQNVFMQDYFSMQQAQHTNFNPNYVYMNRLPYMYNQSSYWHHRNTMFQNMFVAVENHSTAIHQNRFISVQMNNFLVPNITNNMIRSSISRNQFHQNFYQNSLRKLYHHKVVENTSIHCSIGRNALLSEPRQRFWSRNYQRSSNVAAKSNDEVYHSSFRALPGTSSWSELKTKWREEKTITIDDEDTEKDKIEDNNEIQVVGQIRSPLIGPKNANSLEEIFSKLKIIKSASEKTVRRKTNKYKISYNVYSNTQNYRKANPGFPLYRIVVVRQDDPFIQPIELHRLIQDSGSTPIILACVSMSISYVQPGYISVHNLT
ncbi:tRNA splicing endonuclease subunit 54 [Megachile rotundata]|uniref:tRNA splicing endonuclease subunit 54 n=1 Tax=Megachile rotundata TaxID=143995 RepID=UPI003FD2096A